MKLQIIFCALITIIFSACTNTPQSEEKREAPLVVFVTGDHEYSGEKTLPHIAEALESQYGFRTQVLKAHPDQNAEENIPGLEVLEEADLTVFFLRWRRLPEDQVQHIDSYLKSGKPVMGFRTSTHAFNYPENHPLASWNAFGEFALGSPPGWGKAGHTHYGHESTTDVYITPGQEGHPLLKGVEEFHASSWLYHVLPDYPAQGAEWLLMGRAVNPDKDAVENPVAWAWKNEFGGKVFTTTLGHPEDFNHQSFQRLIFNAVHWLLDEPVPDEEPQYPQINVAYEGIR